MLHSFFSIRQVRNVCSTIPYLLQRNVKKSLLMPSSYGTENSIYFHYHRPGSFFSLYSSNRSIMQKRFDGGISLGRHSTTNPVVKFVPIASLQLIPVVLLFKGFPFNTQKIIICITASNLCIT